MDVAGVLGKEVVEALTEVGGSVGHVFHDMGGEHHPGDAFFLEPVEDAEGTLEVLHAVVHAWKDVAVPVGETVEEPAP